MVEIGEMMAHHQAKPPREPGSGWTQLDTFFLMFVVVVIGLALIVGGIVLFF